MLKKVELGFTDLKNLLTSYEEYTKPRESSPEMSLGTAFHLLVLRGREEMEKQCVFADIKSTSRVKLSQAIAEMPDKVVLAIEHKEALGRLYQTFQIYKDIIPSMSTLAVEGRFWCDYKGFRLRGSPDMVGYVDGKLTILDLKTCDGRFDLSDDFGKKKFIMGCCYHMQLALYAMVYEKSENVEVEELSLLVFPKGNSLIVPRLISMGNGFRELGLRHVDRALDNYLAYHSNSKSPRTPIEQLRSMVEVEDWILNSAHTNYGIQCNDMFKIGDTNVRQIG